MRYTTRLPVEKKKKKKTFIKVINALTPTLASPSTYIPSASDSSAHAFECVSSSSRLDPSDPGICSSKPEPESIALGVINEPK